MQPSLWAKISSLYNAAADLDAADRREFMRTAGIPQTLCKVLESLLRYRGVTLRAPVARAVEGAGFPARRRVEGNAATAATHPEWVGRYRILDLWGVFSNGEWGRGNRCYVGFLAGLHVP